MLSFCLAASLPFLKPLLEALINGLKAEPRVATNVCWAFNGLSDAAYEMATDSDEALQPETYCLSPYFDYIVQRLLETTDRPDGAQANLRSAAYEALMEMVKNAPRDCYATVQKTTMVILEKLNHYNDLQSLLCATLQSVLRKVTPQDAPQISDAIMTALLRMLSSDVGKAGGDGGGVQEDALMAVSTLVEVLGEGFVKYMDAFKPYLLMGLKNHNAYQVVTSAVGLIGDIARAMKSKILPHCDELMTLLLENLGDTNVNRSVKPQILSVFGDIAISIGPDFKKYLDVVLQTLVQASAAQVDRTDFDMIEYLNELRDGVLEAYTGIVQGLRGDNPTPGAPSPDLALLEPHVPHVVELIKIIALEPEHSDSNIANCAGLVGDLMSAYEGKFYKIIDVEPVQQLLVQGRRSTMAKTKQVSNWATKEIRKAAKTNQNSW
ncbi:hypothetical protein M8J76_002381 [Diaphorina citri]|nr:hypothetical protein M8J76_002381 [Diaphorina citri]